MDPISITGAVVSVGTNAFNVSDKLYKYIEASGKVDETLKALGTEVMALHAVLESAQRTLTATAEYRANKETDLAMDIWPLISQALDDSQHSVDELDRLMRDVGDVAKDSSILKKAWKQFKLNHHEDELVAIKDLIRSHTTCLHLSFQLLTVPLHFSTSDAIHQRVIPELAEVKAALQTFVQTKSTLDDIAQKEIGPLSETAKLPVSFQNKNFDDHVQQLKRKAEERILATKTSIAEVESPEENLSQIFSSNLSVSGVPLSDAQRDRIKNWASTTIVEEKLESADFESEVGWSSSTATARSKSPVHDHRPNKVDSDPEMKVVEKLFQEGRNKFEDFKFAEAETSFRIGLKSVETFPANKAKAFNLDDISLMFAFSRLQQGDIDESLKVLKSLSPSKWFPSTYLWAASGSPNTAILNVVRLGMAQIYWCQEWRADAEGLCKMCMNNTGNSTGPEAGVHLRSLMMMRRICEWKNDELMAVFYKKRADALLRGESAKRSPYYLEDQQFTDIYFTGTSRAHLSTSFDMVFRALDCAHLQKKSGRALLSLAGIRPAHSIGPGQLGRKFIPTASQITNLGRFLISWRANVNCRDSAGRTPLVLACQSGHFGLAGLLVDAAADTSGISPFHEALAHGHVKIAKLLIEKGLSVDKGLSLVIFSAEGEAGPVRWLLKHGAPPNAIIQQPQPPGGTKQITPEDMAIHYAVCQGKLEIVEILCDAGADVNLCNTRKGKGFPPLAHLIMGQGDCPRGVHGHSTDNSLPIARLLIRHGARLPFSLRKCRGLLKDHPFGNNIMDVLKPLG